VKKGNELLDSPKRTSTGWKRPAINYCHLLREIFALCASRPGATHLHRLKSKPIDPIALHHIGRPLDTDVRWHTMKAMLKLGDSHL
jgi:hypothetical protein